MLPLETPRLIIRPPQAGDGKGINEAKLDGYEDCIAWLSWPKKKPTVQEDEQESQNLAKAWDDGTELRFMCIEKQSGKVLGRFAFPAVLNKPYIPMVAISYFLRKSAQGKGYATEMTNALIRYAFDVLRVRKFEIHCEVENIKSQGIPQRLNLPLERTEIGVWPSARTGKLENVYVYSCFNTDSLPPLEDK